MNTVASRTLLVALCGLVAVSTGCSRNAIDAINLANEGDKSKATAPDEALSKYEQAAQIDPKNHKILWRHSDVYNQKERWADCAAAMSKAAKLAPTYGKYFFRQGYCLAKAAEKGPTSWSEAKGPLVEAIAKDPNLADSYFELANVLLHLDDEKGALDNFTKGVKAHPESAEGYFELASLYSQLGFKDEALTVAKEGVGLAKEGDKSMYKLHNVIGDSMKRKGDINASISSFEAAKKACGQCNQGGEAITLFALGSTYYQANKMSEATQQLNAFQKVVCKGSAAARYRAQCEQAQQMTAKAGGTP